MNTVIKFQMPDRHLSANIHENNRRTERLSSMPETSMIKLTGSLPYATKMWQGIFAKSESYRKKKENV